MNAESDSIGSNRPTSPAAPSSIRASASGASPSSDVARDLFVCLEAVSDCFGAIGSSALRSSSSSPDTIARKVRMGICAVHACERLVAELDQGSSTRLERAPSRLVEPLEIALTITRARLDDTTTVTSDISGDPLIEARPIDLVRLFMNAFACVAESSLAYGLGQNALVVTTRVHGTSVIVRAIDDGPSVSSDVRRAAAELGLTRTLDTRHRENVESCRMIAARIGGVFELETRGTGLCVRLELPVHSTVEPAPMRG
ncbi:MAG: HAMP domain-containing histidine kinase [Polyangiaceae bacterium]|nr:HAMP domain-containing histidine kinase [Polyangiaceae bacterium]